MTNGKEISLVELFKTMVSKSKAIFLSALLVSLLVLVIKTFFIGFNNTTSQTFMIRIPESIDTEYGVYKLINTRNIDYLTLLESERVVKKTIEDLSLPITVKEFRKALDFNLSNKSKPDEASNVTLNFYGKVEENLDLLLPTHIANYVSELNRMYTVDALSFYQHKTKVNLEEVQKSISAELIKSNAVDSILEVLSNQPIFNSFDGSLEKILEVKTETKVRLVTLEATEKSKQHLLNNLTLDLKELSSMIEHDFRGAFDHYIKVISTPSVSVINLPYEIIKLLIYAFVFGFIMTVVLWSIYFVYTKSY
jgi:capsular polysaccharide biosynthesis protein